MKTNPEWHKPKPSDYSHGDIPAKKIQIIPITPAEHARFNAFCGDLHYLEAAKPIGHFLRQAAVFEGEWIGWHLAQRAERLNLIAQNRRLPASRS